MNHELRNESNQSTAYEIVETKFFLEVYRCHITNQVPQSP